MATKDISDLQVCQSVETMWKLWHSVPADQPKKRCDAILEEMTGQPPKVCWSAMERAFSRGFTDYGVSLRGAFLTDSGKALLASNDPDQPRAKPVVL